MVKSAAKIDHLDSRTIIRIEEAFIEGAMISALLSPENTNKRNIFMNQFKTIKKLIPFQGILQPAIIISLDFPKE